MLHSTAGAYRPSRDRPDTLTPGDLQPGEENPAGRQVDFRDDDGDLLADFEVFHRTHRRPTGGFPEGDQPGDPVSEVDDDAEGKDLLHRPTEFLAHRRAVGEGPQGVGLQCPREHLAHLDKLELLGPTAKWLKGVPPGKVEHFAGQARVLDAAELGKVGVVKKTALPGGLTPEAVGDIVTRAGNCAGLGINFTGHSPRRMWGWVSSRGAWW